MSYRFVSPATDVGPGIRPASNAQLFFYDVGTSNPKTTWADVSLSTPNSHPVVSDENGVFGNIFLDVAADASLFDRNGTLIWGPSTVYPPDDAVTGLAADAVTVADTAGYYSATEVEAALAELGLQGLRRDRPETVNQPMTFNAALIRPQLTNFSVTHNAITSATGILTIDLTTGNSFSCTLTENVTIAIVGASSGFQQFTLELTQDSGGGAYTVTQPLSVKTPGGVAYVMSTGNDAIDDLTYRTVDGGTVWKLDNSQAYA